MNNSTLLNWKFHNKQTDRLSPSGYLFVVFPNSEKLAKAKQDLVLSGWAAQDLVEFSGEDLLESSDELAPDRSLLSIVLSKFSNRDQVYHDALKQAGRSPKARLLLVYAPTSLHQDIVDELLIGLASYQQPFHNLSYSQIAA
jgi:hypothetical protein